MIGGQSGTRTRTSHASGSAGALLQERLVLCFTLLYLLLRELGWCICIHAIGCRVGLLTERRSNLIGCWETRWNISGGSVWLLRGNRQLNLLRVLHLLLLHADKRLGSERLHHNSGSECLRRGRQH